MGLFDRFRRPTTGGPAAVRARLEGAMAKRRLRGWNPPLENINTLVASGGPRLLARARELVVTNGYAANACEANLVGDGIKPSSPIDDADLRDRVQRLWLAWTDEADADGLTDFYGLQAMVAREMFVAGECFVRLRPRRAEDGLTVPLQLQLLQSEMLPFEKTGTAANSNLIRCGIEFDAIGRRVAYHFRRTHPGDSTDQRVAVPETVRVPAADVLHIYRPIDAGQIRGLPHIAPAMVRLFLLDQYDDAELDRKKTAAMFAGFITKTAPEEPMMGEAEADLDGAAIAARPVHWIPPRWDWVDPLKDIQAQVLAMEAGITSRRKVVEATGYDVGEVDRENAVDAQRAADLGLRYRTSPGETQGARATPATRPDPGRGTREDSGDGATATDPATGMPNATLAPGTVLGRITASGKYAAHDPAAVDGTETAVAVLWGKANASSGDAPAVALVRGPAVVNRHDLVFAGTPGEGEITAAHAALLDVGIRVR